LAMQARAVLTVLQRMEDLSEQTAPTVRFGCIPRAMYTLMPFLIESLGPGVQLEVKEDGSPALFTAMQQAKLDFAVMRHVSGVAGMVDHLVAHRLYDERPVVIRNPHRPFSPKKVHSLHDLGAHRWVLPALGTTTRTLLESFWQGLGAAPLRPVIETRSYESSVALVSSTDLLSIIPQSIARSYERAGLIRVVDVTPALPGSAVLLVCEEHALVDPVLAGVREQVLGAATRAREIYALEE
jgi:DNA-binding transcriptional LysR family regulator